MPGSLVHDALAPSLQNGTITSNTTGSGVTVNKPGDCRAKLTIGATVTGTSPTLDVEIQGSNDNSTWVKLGRFAQKTASDASTTSFLELDLYFTYVRAVSTVGGTTPSFGSVVIEIDAADFQRQAGVDHA